MLSWHVASRLAIAPADAVLLALLNSLDSKLNDGSASTGKSRNLIVDAGDALVISDWKTARSRWSQEQVEDASERTT